MLRVFIDITLPLFAILLNYPAVPKAFGTRYLISPLPRGEGMKGRVSKIIITKHPHPDPPPSRGRELFGNPDAEHRGIL